MHIRTYICIVSNYQEVEGLGVDLRYEGTLSIIVSFLFSEISGESFS